MTFQSEQTNELFSALAKAQGEFEVAGLNSANPFFKSKYSDLKSLVKASRPALVKYGLSVVFSERPFDDKTAGLYTQLSHSSGQFTSSWVKILQGKSDIQSYGSALSYHERYSYRSIIGLTTGEEEDDGEVVVAETRRFYQHTQEDPKKQIIVSSSEKISAVQLEDITKLFNGRLEKEERFLAAKKLSSLADIPENRYLSFYKEIEAVINGEESAKNKS